MTVAARQSGLKGALGTGILALLAFVGSGSAAASDAVEITPEFQATIERLMEVSKVNEMTEQLGVLMEQQILPVSGVENPEAFEAGFKIGAEMVRELTADGGPLKEIIPIYAKYFSEDDILQLIAFYETPLGQKMIEVMPQLTMDSMQVSMRWMQSKVPELQEQLKARLESEGLINLE